MARRNLGDSAFEQCYRCYPVSFIDKSHLEKGDKIIMPPSALDRLASLNVEYPMLFELSNDFAGRITHCGVLEFIAEEGLIFLPYWMMENMLLQEGDTVQVKSATLAKGTYAKLQPHTMDFLDISNPKAILETTLRSYSCLTTGDTIMVPYNNKRFYINIVETKPSSAVSIIETDCEVEFAPPLDYKEPEKPAPSSQKNKMPPKVEEERPGKVAKFSPFTGSARRLDGKPSTETAVPAKSPIPKQQKPNVDSESISSKSSSSTSKSPGKLLFGSNVNPTPKEASKVGMPNSSEVPPRVEEPKFKAFTGKKYSLID